MGNKVYIGNLSYNTTEENLRNDFSEFGVVTDVKVIADHVTGRSKGFGFITFETEEGAQKAVSECNQSDYMGRMIKVDIATDRPKTNRGGGYRGDDRRGGYSQRY